MFRESSGNERSPRRRLVTQVRGNHASVLGEPVRRPDPFGRLGGCACHVTNENRAPVSPSRDPAIRSKTVFDERTWTGSSRRELSRRRQPIARLSGASAVPPRRHVRSDKVAFGSVRPEIHRRDAWDGGRVRRWVGKTLFGFRGIKTTRAKQIGISQSPGNGAARIFAAGRASGDFSGTGAGDANDETNVPQRARQTRVAVSRLRVRRRAASHLRCRCARRRARTRGVDPGVRPHGHATRDRVERRPVSGVGDCNPGRERRRHRRGDQVQF